MYEQVAMLDAVEAYSLALFTRFLGWTVDRTMIMCAGVKSEIKDLKLHLYGRMHFTYGRKPAEAATNLFD